MAPYYHDHTIVCITLLYTRDERQVKLCRELTDNKQTKRTNEHTVHHLTLSYASMCLYPKK